MIKKIIFSFLLAFMIAGCGGGGAGVDNTLPKEPKESQKANISEYNSKKVALSSYSATSIVKDGDYGDNFYPRVLSGSTKLFKQLSNSAKKLSFRAIASSVKRCSNNGSYKTNKISSNEIEVVYNNCEINSVLYDGKATVKKLNDSYSEVRFKNFTIESYSEKLYIKSVLFKIDSSLGTVKIEDMYATDTKGSKKTEYLNYDSSYIYDSNKNRGTLTFKGWVKTDCIGAFVYLKSTNELAFYDDSGFMNGSMEVSSKGNKVTLSFEDDIVRIYDINNVQEVIDIDNLQNEISLECN